MSSPRGSGPSASLPPSWMPSAGHGEREVRGVEGRKWEICYTAPEKGLEGRARTSAAHARDEVERRPLGFRAPDADGRRERSGRHPSFLPIGACSSARVDGFADLSTPLTAGGPAIFWSVAHWVHRPSFSLNRTHDETVRPRPDQLFHLVAQKRRCSEDTFPRAHHTEKAPRQTRLRRTRLKCSRYRPVPHLALVSRRRERAFVPDTAAAPVSRSGASMENEQRTMMTSWPRRRTSTSRLRCASTSRLRWRC
jgi:hypothetical protein